MTASAFWLRIGGYPATEIAAHTPPTWETLADGGIGEVSWAFALSPRSQHQALRSGATVEVMCGPMPVATTEMTEPDRSTWECHAYGLSSSFRKYIAFATDNNPTRTLQYAAERTMLAGWKGTNPTPVMGTAAGDVDSDPITSGTLFDQYAEQTGNRWGVDGQGRLYMRPDPVTPSWLAAPDSVALGVTDEDVATRLIGVYDTGAGYGRATVGGPGHEETRDLTDRGPMTLAEAEAFLAGMLVRRGGVQWTNGATLHREQLTTRGGTPAFLASVVAGQMLRAHGLASGVVSQAPWLDVVIGRTRYTAGEDVIYVEPVNTAPRSLSGVIAAA